MLQTTLQMALTNSESLLARKQQRDRSLNLRFRQLYEMRIEGMRPSFESIIEKLAAEYFVSPKRVEQILRKQKTPQS